jgi:pimeloyl-ACP methyl ester carboxylesterase
MKSADWPGNEPHRLSSWAAAELAQMPDYYVMDRAKTFAQTVAEAMPTPAQIAACHWLTEPELRVYSAEFERTGFQGGLNYYRIDEVAGELNAFAGRTIDVPACFIAGASEWGPFQRPGALEAMENGACTRLAGVHFVAGAGHSLAEEQPEAVNRLLLDFLARTAG